MIEKYADKFKIGNTIEYIDDYGEKRMQASHYDFKTNTIYMNENKDDDEYAETFRHEYGHFIDHMIGDYSDSNSFKEAFDKDAERFSKISDVGVQNIHEIIQEILITDIKYSQYISDILSALTHNNPDIVHSYENCGYAFYGHDNFYWDGLTGKKNAAKKECFANIFSLYTENNEQYVDFIEKWFPNITDAFKKGVAI